MSITVRKSFYRISELAEILNLGRTATYQLVRSGKIPTIRIGRAIRIPVEALERWIAEQNGNTTGSTQEGHQ